VLDNLSLGLAWRVNYMVQTVFTPVPGNPPVGALLDPSGNPITADIDVRGFNFAGLQAGVFYKPMSNLGLGFTYRNKVVAEGTGTTTTKNPVTGETLVVDTRARFPSPHTFRAGVALSILEDKLLLAADFKYLMYAEAWKQTETTTTLNGVTSTTVTPTYWKDAYNIQLGAEYAAGDTFRPRIGYIMATSATNPAYVQQLMAPPGVSHLVSGGLGIKIVDGLNVDLAAAYVVLQSRVETATQYNAGAGIYGSHSGEFSLSLTYHM
jgi:long-subunit fatty acid transport protein